MTLDRVFPPAVVTSAESAVTAEGKFPNWPPNIVCSSENISVLAGKEAGKLSVKVSDGRPSGVAWIRFFDEASVTGLVPILLSPVAVFSETEPNNRRSEANQIDLPTVVAGRLSKTGDSDAFRLTVNSGETLVASATANQVLQSPMDSVLQLTDTRGNVLVQSDDARGLDPQIVFVANRDQELILRIFAFPETPNSTVGFGGSTAFVYTLDVTTGPFVDHVASDGETTMPFGYNLDKDDLGVLIQPSDNPPENFHAVLPAFATVRGALGGLWSPLPRTGGSRFLPGSEFDGTLPAVLYGHFTESGQTHQYGFRATKGTKYHAEVRSKSDGYLLDAKLTITENKTGKQLATNDDASRNGFDPAVDFTAPQDGVIDVVISETLGEFGPRHFYELRIHQSKPECRLSLAKDHFIAKPGESLEIAVSINRLSGFNQRIQIVATDLPAGIETEPVISEPKGNSAKSVKLKLVVGNSTAGKSAIGSVIGHGSFRVVGSILDKEGKPGEGIVTASFELRPAISINEFWITVPPAKTEEVKP